MQETYPGWSCDELLVPFRDWYFPGAPLGVVECEGVRVRAVIHRKSRAVSGYWPFNVYLEPVEPHGPAAARVPFLADVVRTVTRVDEPPPGKLIPSPFVDWRGFESFEEYLSGRCPLEGQDTPHSIRRKTRRMERDLGPLRFRRAVDDADVFDTLLAWKVEHYRRTGGPNRLERPHNREFYHELRRRGAAHAATLEADGRLVAGKIVMFAGKRQFARMTVYDPTFAHWSPGSVLLLETLRASFEEGDTEFDFLMGDPPYKYTWATHVRWIGHLGREPRLDRMVRKTRSRVSGALGEKPGSALARRAALSLRRLRLR
jgi:hypothetical protein